MFECKLPRGFLVFSIDEGGQVNCGNLQQDRRLGHGTLQPSPSIDFSRITESKNAARLFVLK